MTQTLSQSAAQKMYFFLRLVRHEVEKPMLLGVSSLSGALLVGLFAELMAAAAILAFDAVDAGAPFVGKSWLLPFGVLGAIGGAFMKVTVAPPSGRTENRKLQQLAAEFLAAMFCGVCLMPITINYGHLPQDAYIAMGISFLLATFATGAIHRATPFVERMSIRKALDKTPFASLGDELEAEHVLETRRRAEILADKNLLAEHDSKITKRSDAPVSPPQDQ